MADDRARSWEEKLAAYRGLVDDYHEADRFASSATPPRAHADDARPTIESPGSTPTWSPPSSASAPRARAVRRPLLGAAGRLGRRPAGGAAVGVARGSAVGLATPPGPLMVAPAATPIMTRPLLLVFAASFGAMTGFYLLLSVVPLYAESVGAGGVGAGLVTGTLMAATVAGNLAIPRLLARFGYRVLLAAGLVLLGAPALALPASATMAAILLVTLVRGLGFAICVVVGGALVATLVPPERRGEGLGLFGIVVGVPGVAALPLRVWLVGWTGYPAVFVAGAVAALAGLAVVGGLPGRTGLRGARRGPGGLHPRPLSGRRSRSRSRPRRPGWWSPSCPWP